MNEKKEQTYKLMREQEFKYPKSISFDHTTLQSYITMTVCDYFHNPITIKQF